MSAPTTKVSAPLGVARARESAWEKGARSSSPTSPFLLDREASEASEPDLGDHLQKVDISGGLHRSKPWASADSAALYGIKGWGSPYFGVSDAGHVTVSPRGGTHSLANFTPSPVVELATSSQRR